MYHHLSSEDLSFERIKVRVRIRYNPKLFILINDKIPPTQLSLQEV